MLRMLLRFPKGIFDGAHHLASHCKYGQGYLFSPPMDLETFDAYVDAHELERK